MEIELSNGQLKFWQWDSGQKVRVPENVPTVHFKFGQSAVELPVTDRWVDVPDELLQTGKDILLWTYDEDHTLDAARIPVERRKKPADYIYTPTEIKTWESLDKRIEALEKGGGIAGVHSVNGQSGDVTITAAGLGALTEDDLQSATNAALAQAKASGEFDGAPGAPGTPGAPGADGYSPTVTVEQTDTGATITTTDQAGTTTATVKNGSPGAPGANGTTPHIGDNGNWYLGDTDTGKPSQGPAGAGMDVTGATVGQTVKISAVDSNGVPTAWVPVDMATGGGEWDKVYEQTLTEDVDTYSYDLGDVRAAAIVVAPGADVASGWKKLTVNDIQIPISNSAVSNGTGLALLVDLDSVVKVKAWIGLTTYQVGTYGAIGRVTGSTVIDGITSINKIGVATGTLLKSGSKIEVYVRER